MSLDVLQKQNLCGAQAPPVHIPRQELIIWQWKSCILGGTKDNTEFLLLSETGHYVRNSEAPAVALSNA